MYGLTGRVPAIASRMPPTAETKPKSAASRGTASGPVAMRIAAASGALLLVFMWMASLPLENNPFMDDHLVYAMVLVLLAAMRAGDTLGLGRQWRQLPVVRDQEVLH